jgi:hypothetical protein
LVSQVIPAWQSVFVLQNPDFKLFELHDVTQPAANTATPAAIKARICI